MLFGHGDDITANSRTIEGNFSSNVWFEGYPEVVKSLIADALGKVANYPEPNACSLRSAVASSYGVSSSNVLISNGAIEAIYLVAQAWRNSRSLVVIPTFSEYEDACKLHQHQLTFIEEDRFDGSVPNGIDMVWLCNPNNPTGKIRGREWLLSMLEANPDTLFVVDQSYGTFSHQELLLHSDTIKHSNLILICSFTKCYSIPGIRVGYVAAAEQNIERLTNVKIPWSVNTLAIEVAAHFVSNREQYKLPLERWLALKNELCEVIASINGLEVVPSQTPYFLIRLQKGSSAELKSFLLDNYGLLIRDASNFRGLDNTYVRIAAQRQEVNSKLVKALLEWSCIK